MLNIYSKKSGLLTFKNQSFFLKVSFSKRKNKCKAQNSHQHNNISASDKEKTLLKYISFAYTER